MESKHKETTDPVSGKVVKENGTSHEAHFSEDFNYLFISKTTYNHDDNGGVCVKNTKVNVIDTLLKKKLYDFNTSGKNLAKINKLFETHNII